MQLDIPPFPPRPGGMPNIDKLCAASFEEDVLRLDVAVDDAVVAQVRQRDLNGDASIRKHSGEDCC